MKFFFKRILPAPEKLKRNRFLRPLVKRIGNKKMWQINRSAVASGFAIGLFFGSLPIPIQIPCAFVVAFLFRSNATIAVISTLYSNFVTMPIIFYFNYRVGQYFFGGGIANEIDFKTVKLTKMGGQVLMPLFSGSVIVGTCLAILGYLFVFIGWKWYLHRQLNKRGQWKRMMLAQKNKSNETKASINPDTEQ